MLAAEKGWHKTCKLLIEYGANVNAHEQVRQSSKKQLY